MLVSSTDPILRQPTPVFNFQNPPTNPEALAETLQGELVRLSGIGLAAPQLGLPYRAFAILGEDVPFTIFNPRIIDQTTEEVSLEESCLSIPGVSLDVRRPVAVKVRYQDALGETYTFKFNGMSARCVQHEMDHLDGILFTQRVSRLRLTLALKKAKKLIGKNYVMRDVL
jgi:peptide deformylase